MFRKVSLFIALIPLLLFSAGCSSATVEEVRATLNKDIPIGTHKDNVVKYLESKGISHSANYKPNIYYDKHKEFNASLPKASENPMVKSGIYITFKFDDKNVLIKTTVKEVHTGP